MTGLCWPWEGVPPLPTTHVPFPPYLNTSSDPSVPHSHTPSSCRLSTSSLSPSLPTSFPCLHSPHVLILWCGPDALFSYRHWPFKASNRKIISTCFAYNTCSIEAGCRCGREWLQEGGGEGGGGGGGYGGKNGWINVCSTPFFHQRIHSEKNRNALSAYKNATESLISLNSLVATDSSSSSSSSSSCCRYISPYIGQKHSSSLRPALLPKTRPSSDQCRRS